MHLIGRILDAIERVLLVLFVACAVGLVCYALPRWILASDFHLFPLEIGVFRFIGLVPIILGIVMIIGFTWGLILSGKFLPVLLIVPEELVVGGSYRFVRNPMYVGYCLILFGEALLFKSSALLLYLLVLFLFFHMVVVFVEEPMLKHKFGESYEQYCQSVPRWIPRLSAFRGDISKSS